MIFNDNFSITQLFITKKIIITVDNKYNLIINIKTIKEIFSDLEWAQFYSIISLTPEKIKEKYKIDVTSNWEFIELFLYDLGRYLEARKVYNTILNQLPKLIDNVELKLTERKIIVDGLTINSEIWDYIIYVIKLSYGEKVEKPLVFSSEEARKFYLAQKKLEDKIKKIKNDNSETSDIDNLMKTILLITYSFPSLTFDYLFEQTLAQIHWLQKYAAGAMSYEVNSKIYAAGNMKKGSKLESFIK